MRKIAVVAVFAIVAAMVPASIASAQPTPGSLDGVGTLMVINAAGRQGCPRLRRSGSEIDGVCQKIVPRAPSKTELQIPTGDQSQQRNRRRDHSTASAHS